MDINATIKKSIGVITPKIKEIRRVIHQNPELSGCEFETAELVKSTLDSWGIAARYHLNKTAVSAKITNGAGPTVVLRADMDALPLHEENDVPFASVKPGVMHACGHDMHTAILLGAALVLDQHRDKWRGTVLCLFQPSEEKEPGGAYELIKANVFPKNAAAVFGLHVSPDHKTGCVGLKEGHDYAGVTTFDITIRGRGGHGATPEKTIDPIVCAAAVVTQLQTIISREKSAVEPAVLTIGKISAGSAHNIIPDTATMSGTIRTYSQKLQDKILKRVRDLTTATAAGFGAKAEVMFAKSYPPGYNDPALTKEFAERMTSYLGRKSGVIERGSPTMYAEDFARYQQLVPGLYAYLGVAAQGTNKTEGLHSPRFLPDEKAIETGIAAHTVFALGVLGAAK